jgi:hypothetical protein
MAKKQSKSAPKKTAGKERDDEMFDALLSTIRAASMKTPIDPYKELLAKVAGSVAAGLATAPSPSISSAASMATAALDIAAHILEQAGISATDTSDGAEGGSFGAAS